MALTDIAAWLGAATGSVTLLWEIYKWAKSGPKLIISVNPNMISAQQERFVMISIRNTGDRKTTVQAVGFDYFESTWSASSFVPDGYRRLASTRASAT